MASSLVRTLVIALSVTMVASIADPVKITESPVGYMGCYREGFGGRLLTQAHYEDLYNMTTESCESFCAGFRYFAAEYGTECYCGTQMEHGGYQVPDSACHTPCAGDTNATCGGGNLLSVYKTPFATQQPRANYTYLGCAGEPTSARALDHVVHVPDLTRHECLVICYYGGFQYGAVENGDECWCGDKLNPDAKLNATCDLPCAGKPSETCGGRNALNLFHAALLGVSRWTQARTRVAQPLAVRPLLARRH